MFDPNVQTVSVFDRGMQNLGDAVKVGVKLQEDAAKWWADAIEKTPAQEWQKKGRSVLADAIPVAQKNAEDLVKVIEENYRRSVDLMKKACSAEGCEGAAAAGVAGAQAADVWEMSMKMVRDTAQAVTQANFKLMEAWTDMVKNAGAAAAAAAPINGHGEGR